MREDAYKIIKETLADCLPDKAVRDALEKLQLSGRVYVAAIGKAAWVMAKTAADFLGNRLETVSYTHLCKTPDTELLPFGGRMRICTSHGKLEPICNFIPAFPIYPPEFSWIREKSGEGAVYAGILESGSRVVYFAADIDRCYSAYHIPDHHRLLEGAVRWAGGGNFPVTVQAPAHVNCNVYRQEEQYLIQFCLLYTSIVYSDLCNYFNKSENDRIL